MGSSLKRESITALVFYVSICFCIGIFKFTFECQDSVFNSLSLNILNPHMYTSFMKDPGREETSVKDTVMLLK